MGPEWFNFGRSSKLGRPNSPRYGDILRLSPRLHGRSTAPVSTVVGRTGAATSGKSGALAAYIGDGLPPVPAKLAAKIRRWELTRVNTPLQWEEWERLLQRHPDKRLRFFLVHEIQEGFRIGFSGTVQSKSAANMPSTAEQLRVIDDCLAEECSEGRVLGPLSRELFPQVNEVAANCGHVFPK